MFILIVVAVAFLGFPDSEAHSTFSRTGEVKAQTQSAELAEANELEKKVVNLYVEGKYKDALPLAVRVLQIRERASDPDVQSVRSAYLNLAEVYLELGEYGEAQLSMERVVESYRKLNPNDVRLADVLERIAMVHFARKNKIKAESAHLEAVRLKENVLGADNPATMKSVLELAEFYQLTGDNRKAIPHYQRLLGFHEGTKGPNQQKDLAEVVQGYACALRRLNKHEDAKSLEREVVRSAAPKVDAGDARAVGNILNGEAIRFPKPAYPEAARALGIVGTVIVRITVDEKGNVIKACAISGPIELARSSELAAYGAKFPPTKLNGQTIKVKGSIRYNYVIG